LPLSARYAARAIESTLSAVGKEFTPGGRDGRQKWTWGWLGQNSAIPTPLLVDFDGTGRNSVCLFITEIIKTPNSTTYQPRLVIFDGAGKVRKKIDAKGSGNIGGQFYGNQTWWRAINIGGGPKQALLFFDEKALQAIGGDSLEPFAAACRRADFLLVVGSRLGQFTGRDDRGA
jgi:hypothetical protein